MERRTESDSFSQARLGEALKTTVRDVLCELFRTKFALAHPGKKPYDVLKTTGGNQKLKENSNMKKAIKADEREHLDITALVLLLKHCCGLSNKSADWRSKKTLEGNIDALRILRNEDGHWTKGANSNDSVEKSWARMEKAAINVLEMGDLKDHIPRFKEDLKRHKIPILRDVSAEVKASMLCELRDTYNSGGKTTQMPFVWGGKNFSFHHRVTSTYTSSKFSFPRDGSTETVESDDVVGVRGCWGTMIVQGESGTGKTSLLRYYAARWSESPCPLPSLSAFDFLLFLDCNAVASRTFKVYDILQEIFPKSTSKWKPGVLLKLLTQMGSSVMFMIDAFDERLDAFQSAFQMLQKTCPEAFFLITTRPHCMPAIGRLCEKEVMQVTAHGFSRLNARNYVGKLLAQQGKCKDPDDLLQLVCKHKELMAIPQLLCWCTWLWLEEGDCHFCTLGRTFMSVTEFLLKKMCHINGKRVLSGEVSREGERWLSAVAEVAFKQKRLGRSSLKESSDAVKKLYKEAAKLHLHPREAVSILMQCDESHMSGGGESITFQFLHTSHANFLAAYHICETLQKKQTVTLPNLLQGFGDEEKEILPFVVSVLFQKAKGRVDPKRIEEIASVAKRFVRFFDINFYLTLIEESGHSEILTKELAKNMPEDTSVDPLATRLNGESQRAARVNGLRSSHVPTAPMGHLWIRKKELMRSGALSLLLSHSHPARLWVRLSDGEQSTEAARSDTMAAMRLVSKSYGGKLLCDLRVSGLESATPLQWPKNLWWLTVEQSKMKGELGLRKGLLKVTFRECSGIEKVKIPSSVSSMTLEGMEVEDFCVPEGVKTLRVESCSIKRFTSIATGLEKVDLINCYRKEKIDSAVSLSLQRQMSESKEDEQTRSR